MPLSPFCLMKSQWAMTINGPWRICFHFEDCDAWEVEIVDYH
jgi:proteic killer suppression protein